MKKYKIAWRVFMTLIGAIGGYFAFHDAISFTALFGETDQFKAWGFGFLFAYGSTLLLYDDKPE